MKERKSIRHYSDKKVEQEKIDRIIECATQAPSARNKQDWRFIQVEDQEMKFLLAHEASQQDFLEKAPVVLVCCGIGDNSMLENGQSRAVVNTIIAVDHILLAAVENGLATCWVGNYNPQKVRELLSIPDEVEVAALISIGYPEEEDPDLPRDPEKKRRPVEQIRFHETWAD